jgi:Domain of unknown function (DUF4423)
LAQYLQIPIEKIEVILEFLLKHHLIKKENDRFEVTQNWVRLDRLSPHIIKHHTNWRLQAIRNLENASETDLHYSGVYSIDASAASQIKNHFLDFIKSELKIVENAPEKDLYVLSTDLFSLCKNKTK